MNINTCADDSASIVVPAAATENNAAPDHENSNQIVPSAPEQTPGKPDGGTTPGNGAKADTLAWEILAPARPSGSAAAPLESRVEPPVVQITTIAKIVSGMVALDRLKSHPKNNSLYGEEKVDDLVDSIRNFGLKDPPVVDPNGMIISGHRRVRAAKEIGLTEVLVKVFEPKDELDLWIALLEHNRQRIKSKEQIVREFELRLEIQQELARRRQATNAKKDAQQVENFPLATKGKARDVAGKETGISGRSGENGIRVLDTIERLQAEGKAAEAKEIEDKLKKSIDGAHKFAIDKGYIQRPGKSNAKKATEPMKATPPPPMPPAATPAMATQATVTPTEAPPPATAAEELPPAQPELPPSVETVLKAPAQKKLDSDGALMLADKILDFLRSRDANSLTPSQKQSWSRLFSELEACRTKLGITKLTTK